MSKKKGRRKKSGVKKVRQVPFNAVRAAEGRERGRDNTKAATPLATAALDIIARHRASGAPMPQLIKEMASKRRLGNKERRILADALFAWARRHVSLEEKMLEVIKDHGGIPPSRREKDMCALQCVTPELGAAPPKEPLDKIVAENFKAGLPPIVRKKIAHHEDSESLAKILLEPAVTGFCVHPTIDRDEVLAHMNQHGDASASPLADTAIASQKRIPMGSLPKGWKDLVWPMNVGSQFISFVAQPPAGEPVLDLCGGGGGKAKLLASLGHEVLVCDVDRPRLENVRERDVPGPYIHLDGRRPPFAAGSFARILVDAPCSASGTLQRAPTRGGEMTEERIQRYALLQFELLQSALKLCRPDGVVIYATCSFFREENELVVERAMKDRLCESVSLRSLYSRAPDAPTTNLRPDRDNSDGFFVAALRPRAS